MEKVKNIKWTPEQCDKLREMYNTHDVADIAAYFGCSRMNIYFKARKLGLKKHRKNVWSKEENAIMRRLWPDKKEIARRIGKSVEAVSEHARLRGLKLGLRSKYQFSPEEDQKLRELYETEGRKGLSVMMNIPEESIKSRAEKLGLRVDTHRWTESDLELLKDKFLKCDRLELEKIFNRSSFSIYRKAYQIGLKKPMSDHVSKASVKSWMRLSYRRRGLEIDMTDNPAFVELHRARIMLTRKIKAHGPTGKAN